MFGTLCPLSKLAADAPDLPTENPEGEMFCCDISLTFSINHIQGSKAGPDRLFGAGDDVSAAFCSIRNMHTNHLTCCWNGIPIETFTKEVFSLVCLYSIRNTA